MVRPESSPTPDPGPAPAGRRADSPRVLRAINDQVVLALLLEQGPLTRARVGALTGLSKPTISSLLTGLEARGLVTTTGVVEGGPGPNAKIYAVDPSAGHVIAVHVEQHGSNAVLADLTGTIISSHEVQVPVRRSASPVTELAAAVDGVLAGSGIGRDDVTDILIATPGVIDATSGTLRHARHLHGWESPGLTGTFRDVLGTQVRLGNDVNLAAVAEGTHGAAQGHHDYALLWLDRGVGLGLVLDGRIRSGAHGGAGEIGYLPVPGVAPTRVDRGGAGAFQQLVGGQGLRALAKEHGIRGRDSATIVAAALDSGRAGEQLLDALAQGVALGASAISALVDPGLIVLAGPVALAGGERLRELVDSHLRHSAFVRPELVTSTLTADAVLLGAVEIALRFARASLFGAGPVDQATPLLV